MNYQTYPPHPDLASLVKCYWTLEIPATHSASKQRIIPDGCIEMAFLLGDDIKRYVSEVEFILQPRAMVLGQTLSPFYIEPTGYVHSFAVRFYPFGFANFVTTPINELANRETPLDLLFGATPVKELTDKITQAENTLERISVIETFLLSRLENRGTVDHIVKRTVDALFASQGNTAIHRLLGDNPSTRKQLERKFARQIGISPKQLGKIIRLQTALYMLLDRQAQSLTHIAYDSHYYDQSHFIKDFREFTGISPKRFLKDEQMLLSSIFYAPD
jgi:AraC-like DNA-binding protein